MTPGEVASLQALAQQHGGSLSINPQTGLPEAGFLSALLPMAAGAGLAAMGMPAGYAALAVGATSAATNGGDMKKAILNGFSAYTGAGMAGSFMDAGAAMQSGTATSWMGGEAPVTAAVPTVDMAPSAGSLAGASQQEAINQAGMYRGPSYAAEAGNVSLVNTAPAEVAQAAAAATPAAQAAQQAASLDTMNMSQRFDALKAGASGTNAMNYIKANPFASLGTATAMLTPDENKTPQKAADTDRGPRAGLSYHPGWNNPMPKPNMQGIEQTYNRPYYAAEGGLMSLARGGRTRDSSKQYDDVQMSPAMQQLLAQQDRSLREIQRLKAQQAGAPRAPIDEKQLFADYLGKVASGGGTGGGTGGGGTGSGGNQYDWWQNQNNPVPTPAIPETPEQYAARMSLNARGGGGGKGQSEGAPGEGFNPTSEGAYAVSQAGKQLGLLSPYIGAPLSAYGNYLARNVNPNYGHEARHSVNTPYSAADEADKMFAKPETPYSAADEADKMFAAPYSTADEADRMFAAPENNQNYIQGLAMQQAIAANPMSPQDANKALRNAYYQSYPRVTTTPEAQQAAIDRLTSDNFYADKPDYTTESLQQTDAATNARLLSLYPAETANAQAADFAALAPVREYNAAAMAKLTKEAEARQNAALSAQFNKIAETPALREQFNKLNLGFQTDVENNAEPGDRYAPVSYTPYVPGAISAEADTTPDVGAEDKSKVAQISPEAVALTEAALTSAALANASATPFSPLAATPTGTYYNNSMAGDRGFVGTGGFGNVWRSADGTPITTGDGSSLQTGQGAQQESSNDKVNRIIREAQIAAGEGTFGEGTPPAADSGFSMAQFGTTPAAPPAPTQDPAQAQAAAQAAAQAQADREQAGREAARQAEAQAAANAAAAQASQQAAVESAGGGRGGGGGNAPDGGSRSWGGASSQEGGARGTAGGWAQGGGIHGGLPNPYNLGSYSDGGRLLKGPGDGVSDSIPATIGKGRPARLADGEFVIPARIVSEIGNGSTDAGARKLYAMMDRIQAGRKKSVGKGKVAVNSRADKYLPA